MVVSVQETTDSVVCATVHGSGRDALDSPAKL